MKRKRIEIGLNKSPVDVVDVGSGLPILLVHGFPLDHQMWRFQIKELSKRFRVICPDLPGFGTSPAKKTPMSIEGIADDLALLLEGLKVDGPVAYCGLSMGGYIGWQFLRRYPDRVSHLIACDTRAADDTEQVRRARNIAAQSVLNTGAKPVADAMIQKLFYNPEDPERANLVQPIHKVISGTDPNSIASGQLAMAARADSTEMLGRIDLPTLFVVGEHDGITAPDEMKKNSELVERSNFVTISDAGHLAPLENHAAFNRAVIDFLNPS